MTNGERNAHPDRPHRVALICHADERVNRELVLRWLGSFMTVVGVVQIEEGAGSAWRRLRAEYRRVGLARLLDVLFFRIYYRLRLAAQDQAWEKAQIERLSARFPAQAGPVPVLRTADPNSSAVVEFLRDRAPDITVARCKRLLRREVYSVPTRGTFIMHPGICPQYRNSHGCFWALANRDLANVGLTLLQIDEGIDTGPIYGFFRCRFDELQESHITIQHRVLLENLDAIQSVLLRIAAGRATPIEVTGKLSRVWGQPWLSAYLAYRRSARRTPRCA